MLSNLSVKKPYTIIVFIIIIAILGVVAYVNMPVDLLPNMNLPYIAIVVVAPGSSPEDVEAKICAPVEQEMATIDNVKRITSTSNEHYGLVLMEFNGGVDLNSATLDIQSGLVTVKSGFPDMAMDPIIMKLDPTMLAVMNLAISEDGSTINDSSEYLKSIGDQILSVEGVASVSYEGLIDNMVLVMLDNQKLNQSMIDMLAPERDDFVDEVAYDAAVLATPLNDPLPNRDDFVDEVAYQEALDNVAEIAEMASSMIGQMLKADVVGMALYAQNFNMPAGNISLNGVNYLVKIGDNIHSLDELQNMSILSIDFKSMVSNYDQIVEMFRGVTISQATIDALIALGDPDGTAQTAVRELADALENIEDSPYFEKIIDPISGDVTYEIDQSIVDGLHAIGETADELEDFVMTAEALESVELLDSMIEYFEGLPTTEEIEDIISQLEDLRDTLVSIREMVIGGGMLVEQPRIDGLGNPVIDPVTSEQYIDYVINPNMIDIIRTFNDLGDSLEGVVITEQQLLDAKLAVLGLNSTFNDISSFAIASQSFLNDPTYFNIVYLQDEDENYLDSEGNITIDPDEYVVLQYEVNTDTIDAIKNLPALTFKVNQMANVVQLNTAGDQFSIVNGTPGVMLSIQKQSDYSTVTVSNGVRDKLAEIMEEDPNFRYIMLNDQGEYVVYMIQSIVKNLLVGAGFAIAILFFFLRRLKPTFIVGSSIFISVVAAFVLMYFAGVTINIISMTGLALGVGMLVDNSIVVIENIYRKRTEGESVFEACVQGAKQVSGAVIASTLTTVIIFLPIAFIDGITKQLFTDIAYTITFSLAASLLVALTFVPMATSRILKSDNQIVESKMFEKAKIAYAKSMEFFLNKKWILIVTVLILFSTSVCSVFFMNRIFFPPSDMGYVTITANIVTEELPSDVSYNEATGKVVDFLEKTISKQDYVKDIGIQVSSGLSMLGVSAGSESITANVVLIDDGERMTAAEIVDDILLKCKTIPGLPDGSYTMYGSSESMEIGIVSDNSLTFNIYGDELEDTRLTAKELAILLSEVEGVDKDNVSNGVGTPPLEYKLIIDPAKASPYGVYVAQALQTMQAVLAPPSSCTTIKFDSTRLNYDVTVYGAEYQLIRWYKTYDLNNNIIKVFIDKDETYYIKNNNAENEEDAKIIVNRISNNEELTNIFSYTIDGAVYTVEGEGDNMIVYYSVALINDIDLVTYELASVIMPGTDYEAAITVPLYKILKDESFKKDDNGNTLYRIKEDEDGRPIFLKDEFDEYILDGDGNPIPDYVLDNDGDKIPVAIAMSEGYLSISHEDGTRKTTISVGLLTDANTDKVLARCEEVIASYQAPLGVTIEVQGESEIITDAYQTLLVVLVLGIVLIYLVMVAQFQSLKSPLIVMFTVPLAFTGSVFAMLIAGQPISIVALVGLVILMGIVVNNGIVFVDYVNQLLNEGMERRKALIKAGKDRIRPILMTALTTIFALVVMALDNSAQGAMMQPMAISTIGGMIYATALTIYFVPIMFDIFNKKKGVVVEERKLVGPIGQASMEFVPYEAIERYKDETPYDTTLLEGKINTRSLSKENLLEIYEIINERKKNE